jgi:DinB family protein
MNRAMQEKWSWIEATHSLRSQLLESLSNADLAFSPGGENVTLGTLLRESGDVEYSYIQSLKTFKQDWSSHHTEAGLESDLTQIKAWYSTLDEEMKTTLAAFSDEDLSKTIDRGGGSSMPVEMQLDTYLQAQLIYLGKAGVYFRAMNRALPQVFQEYIG